MQRRQGPIWRCGAGRVPTRVRRLRRCVVITGSHVSVHVTGSHNVNDDETVGYNDETVWVLVLKSSAAP